MEDTVTFRRTIRISAFPRDAVMERKMFRAKNNSSMPAGDSLSTCFILLMKASSGVEFAIGTAFDPWSN